VDILARSFQRAANMSTLMAETRAHMRAGIIQENLRQLPKAVERYTKFLGWCARPRPRQSGVLSDGQLSSGLRCIDAADATRVNGVGAMVSPNPGPVFLLTQVEGQRFFHL